ncbi:lytic transglycosylase domain-containing protein (plasmid) [Sphingomonas paeninsulae]|uniref:Lytic transglycosylase domain-containing protein n=1 Tax=Sphingomonas paeninsulae TaxID=2319844 RepID=A0A494TG60_SPHPE|nr:lytic transglycosylase domain-containing protein [Sphingomonas paeninsulae]AYJ84836.1 lytic transglycosylase domain-containing protein [Sphingomonas paeninsulae]
MGALKGGMVIAIAIFVTRAEADPIDRWQPIIAEASLRFGIPTPWIARVMRAESGGNTMLDGRPTVSRAGALGLMQLMPATWNEMRTGLALGLDPHDPHDNIIAGTAYLRAMFDRFGYPGLFAAYNAGPGRYAAYLRGAGTLPGETRAYLAEVAGDRTVVPQNEQPTPVNTLFAVRNDRPDRRSGPLAATQQDMLFVTLPPH